MPIARAPRRTHQDRGDQPGGWNGSRPDVNTHRRERQARHTVEGACGPTLPRRRPRDQRLQTVLVTGRGTTGLRKTKVLIRGELAGASGGPAAGLRPIPGAGLSLCAVKGRRPTPALSLHLCILRKRAFYRDTRLPIRTCYYLFDFSCSSH